MGNEREGGDKTTPGFLFRGTEWEKVPFTKTGRLWKDYFKVGKMERLVLLKMLSVRCLCTSQQHVKLAGVRVSLGGHTKTWDG